MKYEKYLIKLQPVLTWADDFRQKYQMLPDLFFCLFVISSILLWSTPAGKVFQFAFVVVTLFYAAPRYRFCMYHVLEWIFVLYVLIQSITGIAKLPFITLSMTKTMLYTALFSLGMYHYLMYGRSSFTKVIQMYVMSSALGLLLTVLFFFPTIKSNIGLNSMETIRIGGISVLGGAAPTSLAMLATLPSFFLMLITPEEKKKIAYAYVAFFLLVTILTGTRKVLLLYAFILILERELLRPGKKAKRIAVMLLATLVIGILAVLAMIYIPALHDMIGYRLENTIRFYTGGGNVDASMRVRERMIRGAMKLFRERPVAGWGMDYYKFSGTGSEQLYSHNNFTELLSGGGVIGFLIYYAKYVYLLVMIGLQIKLNKEGRDRAVVCLIFFLLMIVMEYWQVMYFYRFFMIYQVMLLVLIRKKMKWESANET